MLRLSFEAESLTSQSPVYGQQGPSPALLAILKSASYKRLLGGRRGQLGDSLHNALVQCTWRYGNSPMQVLVPKEGPELQSPMQPSFVPETSLRAEARPSANEAYARFG
jgi:hypothetical protein